MLTKITPHVTPCPFLVRKITIRAQIVRVYVVYHVFGITQNKHVNVNLWHVAIEEANQTEILDVVISAFSPT